MFINTLQYVRTKLYFSGVEYNRNVSMTDTPRVLIIRDKIKFRRYFFLFENVNVCSDKIFLSAYEPPLTQYISGPFAFIFEGTYACIVISILEFVVENKTNKKLYIFRNTNFISVMYYLHAL